MSNRVLMIEDDNELSSMLAHYLGGFGIQVTVSSTAMEGLQRLARETFDALLLDIMLPDADGLDVCRKIRAGSGIPILMLTARGEDTDRIVGLEIGADDYLPKPFNPRELLARLRAILRRGRFSRAPERRTLHFGRLEIDPGSRSVRVDDEEKILTGYQFDLLLALAENAGRVMSREAILDRMRGAELDAFDRSIDVHVSRIRAAIERDPKHPRRILTVRGAGYVFARAQDED